jgi:hypothetical protein
MTDYAVVPADLHRDRDELLEVWRRNLPPMSEGMRQKAFDWYYLDNPYGRGRCWLLLAGRRVVGAAGVGLRRIRVGHATVLAGHASDLAVDQEHRVLKPAAMLQKAALGCLAEDLAFIYTVPNDKALAAMRLVGFQVSDSLRRYVKVLQSRSYLKSLRPLARSVAAPVADVALRLRSAETWRRSQGHRLVEMSEFDQRFDCLWARTASRFPFTAERTAQFLRWRYSDCPLREYRLLGLLAPQDDQLAGYVVFTVDDNHRAEVIDLMADDSQEAWRELLSSFAQWSRLAGFHSITIAASESCHLTRELSRFGFRVRPGSRGIVTCPSPSDLTSSWGVKSAAWYFVPGDEDYN